ncbi:hypothetical protein [Priestia megaterium]|uniref:hypothetical protein n=1 Tax=Priestia megaterium TaxID=1404 RepID=UPI00196AB38D|nr:hypothetical protein [Priestia megaterium]QSF41524.1 hypothetical protein ICR96_12960 [Priestia megaterium]
MRKTENLIIILSLLSTIFCICILFDPYYFSKINNKLNEVNNLMTFASMLFAALALLIASIAYKKTAQQPKLRLSIKPWMAEEEGPALVIERGTGLVTITRPYSSWNLFIKNSGEISAKNPVVKIVFKGTYFSEDDFPGWKAVDHANACGWYGFLWIPNENESQVVHPMLDYKLPTMYFSEKYVGDNEVNVQILIAADEMETQKYDLPVRIKVEDFSA